MLASLAKDAAELLWEMVATEDLGEATQQMRENAVTIQVRTGCSSFRAQASSAASSETLLQ